MNNKICVFDFETDGSNPLECSPVQLAALMIDPKKLEIIEGSEFNVYLKPERLEKPTKDLSMSVYAGSDILDWHGKVKGVDASEIFQSWMQYPDQKHSWQQFLAYLDKYHAIAGKSKSQFSAPLAAGYNIIRFDMKIVDRLSVKYGQTNKENQTNIFHPRDRIDIMNIAWLWLSNVSELKSLSLDSLRNYLGINKDNAHDAMKDVRDCADILIRFLRLHKNLSAKIQFKGSFENSI